MNDCRFCKNSYYAGDEILCIGFKEPNTCDDFDLDDYFKEQIRDYKEELKQNNR